MPARVDRIAYPFAAASRGNIGKPLACCSAHLLKLVQYVCPRLFQERSPLLTQLDGVGKFNRTWDVWHVANYLQRRAITTSALEIKSKSFRQLQLRYAQVVLGGNDLWEVIVILHFRLQHVEPWNRSRFKPVLLVFQLRFQKTRIFLVHPYELAVDDDLVKLRFHCCDERIQDITESEVGAVAL